MRLTIIHPLVVGAAIKFPLSILHCGLIAILGLVTAAAKAEEPSLPLPYGLDAMQRLDLLPYLPPNGTQTRQFVSYDTSARNSSNAANFRRYEENGEWVFFDEKGPGCLYRMQMNVFSPAANFPNEKARIRFYFDGEARPRIDMTFAELFGKGGKYMAPFTPPLAYFDLKGTQWMKGPGAYAILYYPLPFGKRLKIAASLEGGMKPFKCSWYQFTYLKYPSGTAVTTWQGTHVDSPQVRWLWENMGQDPKPATAADQLFGLTAKISKGSSAVLLDLSGSGRIGGFRLTMTPWNKDLFGKAVLRITWDDQKVPAVEMPIGCLFGGGGDTIGVEDVSAKTFQTFLFGFDAKTRQFHSYWPMPFWSRAKFELVNDSPSDIDEIKLEASYTHGPEGVYPRRHCGYFFAKRTIDISPDNALWSHAFQTSGHGKVLGIMMYTHGYDMDGDEMTYIDGAKSPQIHGDGTEDDHNQGWGGYAIQQPCWGGLISGFQGGYRLYLNEPYVFNREIAINYEHSLCAKITKGQKTDCIVWYYLRDPALCNLCLTDELDVADAASEKAHQYAVTRPTWSGETTSAYQTCEQGIPYPVTDRGRAFVGASTFTVKIDPNNEGVKLRRRLNRHLANVQEAKVSVDGREIRDTPWYFCDLPAPPQAAFADTDFEIPAAYTKGKQRISITVEHVKAINAATPAQAAGDLQTLGCNEYYYWVYSYGPTPLPGKQFLELRP